MNFPNFHQIVIKVLQYILMISNLILIPISVIQNYKFSKESRYKIFNLLMYFLFINTLPLALINFMSVNINHNFLNSTIALYIFGIYNYSDTIVPIASCLLSFGIWLRLCVPKVRDPGLCVKIFAVISLLLNSFGVFILYTYFGFRKIRNADIFYYPYANNIITVHLTNYIVWTCFSFSIFYYTYCILKSLIFGIHKKYNRILICFILYAFFVNITTIYPLIGMMGYSFGDVSFAYFQMLCTGVPTFVCLTFLYFQKDFLNKIVETGLETFVINLKLAKIFKNWLLQNNDLKNYNLFIFYVDLKNGIYNKHINKFFEQVGMNNLTDKEKVKYMVKELEIILNKFYQTLEYEDFILDREKNFKNNNFKNYENIKINK